MPADILQASITKFGPKCLLPRRYEAYKQVPISPPAMFGEAIPHPAPITRRHICTELTDANPQLEPIALS
jgi:hypothetical protein